MPDDTVTIEVDGKSLSARKGQMLIEVTDGNGIYVPRFCYHKKLSVAANCRMCLVDVEKAPKPLPACATPVMDGMVVRTRSQRAIEAQKAVMEFLLINHPLDCPICDQGGECELQDLAMGYGRDVSRYQEKKRVVKDKNIGPLVQTDMTRCIQCTRCVRFGEEIAGMRELGATGRGEHMEIGTYIEKSMVSEMSGNVIDICPVGALTSKPFRFSARSWEMQQRETIAPHDSVGSSLQVHIKRDHIMRVVPGVNESINEVWISDRDRFSYEGLYHPDRLTVPMIREDAEWHEVNWETALQYARDGLQKIKEQHGANAIGALASPSATVEELYLLQKFMRGIGSHNIDHRLRQGDFSQQMQAPPLSWLGRPIAQLEKLDAVLLVGSHVRKEQPIINHRLRKASMRGARMLIVNPVDYSFNFDTTEKIITAPALMAREMAGILKALVEEGGQADDAVNVLINQVNVSETQRAIARHLLESEQGHVLLGNLAVASPDYHALCAIVAAIARLANVTHGYLGESANTVGAQLAGVLPHRGPAAQSVNVTGLDAMAMLAEPRRAYLLQGIEPELDCWHGQQALTALHAADFVINLTPYLSDTMRSYADVLLPIAFYTETAGTFVNTEGDWLSFNGVVSPAGEARPAWKVMRVMGNLFELPGFDYQSSIDVRDEMRQLCSRLQPDNNGSYLLPDRLPAAANGLQRIADIPMNSVDSITRRSGPLQATKDVSDGMAHINSRLAGQLGVKEGDTVSLEQDEISLAVPVTLDERLPDGCVLVQGAQHCHAKLGGMFAPLEVKRS